jgi:hypothetical protein
MLKSPLRLALSIAVLAFATGLAQAHPGHGLHDASPTHLLTSPDHLAVLALGGAAAWFGARWVGRRLPRRLLQILGVAALTTAAVLWGIRA